MSEIRKLAAIWLSNVIVSGSSRRRARFQVGHFRRRAGWTTANYPGPERAEGVEPASAQSLAP
jgi:hypothetical protein